jgi:hypothetical protein
MTQVPDGYTPMYSWREPYEAAILETDPSSLSRLIAIAEAAIDARLAELRRASPADAEEMAGIDQALARLEVLRKATRTRKAG